MLEIWNIKLCSSVINDIANWQIIEYEVWTRKHKIMSFSLADIEDRQKSQIWNTELCVLVMLILKTGKLESESLKSEIQKYVC